MSLVSTKREKSAKKAAKKWEVAKMEGIHVTPYELKGEPKARILVPAVVTLANYFVK